MEGLKKFLNHLKDEVLKHLSEYLFLLTGGVFFLFLLSLFQGSRVSQFFVLTFFVLFYLIWGVVHHLIEKTLHFKIVLEYILIGAIAFFILEILLVG